MPAQQVTYKGFIGGTYQSLSLSEDGEETINLFPEAVESKQTKAQSQMVFYRTPGLRAANIQGGSLTGPIQGMFACSTSADVVNAGLIIDTAIIVCGVSTVGNWDVFRVAVTPQSNPPLINLTHVGLISNPGPNQYVDFAANDHQILIVSNPNGYIYNALANTFVQITATGFNGAVTCTTVDGFFVVNNPNSNTFSVSAFNDGTVWSGIDQESTQDYPDTLRAVSNYYHFLQLFSGRRSERYYDTGSNSALFARLENSYQYYGIVAPWSRAYLDNTLFYLGQNENGQGIVCRLQADAPKRVSNQAMESAIQKYVTTQDAFGWAYQDGGHLFYVLHFPSAIPNPNHVLQPEQPVNLGVTWVYDATTSGLTGMDTWHKRMSWNPGTGQYTAHAGRFYMYAGGFHLVGDFAVAQIYQLTLDAPTDNGVPIRWVRTAPHISTSMFQNTYSWFQVDMQTGTGLANPLPGGPMVVPGWGNTVNMPPGGDNPVVQMTWSDDGGFSFSSELQMAVGKIGQTRQLAVINCLGVARDFVASVFSTDPGTTCIQNAFLGIEEGIS
jgi:hypothetical protein